MGKNSFICSFFVRPEVSGLVFNCHMESPQMIIGGHAPAWGDFMKGIFFNVLKREPKHHLAMIYIVHMPFKNALDCSYKNPGDPLSVS
jgi:hypothetical protein